MNRVTRAKLFVYSTVVLAGIFGTLLYVMLTVEPGLGQEVGREFFAAR